MTHKSIIVELNGRIFAEQSSTSTDIKIDGYFQKEPNGLLLKNKDMEAIAFLVNGLQRKESPFLVTARFVERFGGVRYQLALCSIMDKFFNIVPEGEFYPDRELAKLLYRDCTKAVKAVYGTVHSGIS